MKNKDQLFAPIRILGKFFLLNVCFTACVLAEPIKAMTVTNQIKGSAPILKYVGAQFAEENILSDITILPTNGQAPQPIIPQYTIIKQIIDAREVFLPTVNSVLEIPKENLSSRLFYYIDIDGDEFLSNSEVKWYSSELKNPLKRWPDSFTNFTDVSASPESMINESDLELTPIPSFENNPFKIQVPISALNKRISVSITPKSKTGFPANGQKIFIADLNYFMGQEYDKGKSPANVIPAELAGNNFNSGGGIVSLRPGLDSKILSYEFFANYEYTVKYEFIYKVSDILSENELNLIDSSIEEFQNTTLFILKRADTGRELFRKEAEPIPGEKNKFKLEFKVEGEDKFKFLQLIVIPQNKMGIIAPSYTLTVSNPGGIVSIIETIDKATRFFEQNI
ncbi:hypothetical protein [Thorsellia kenyensis]|uniref:Uncharacterized protein n=1 Tax=Thorsellia kenyensis TaxID=1549888 RepID=A0ABV6C913_9GAMM